MLCEVCGNHATKTFVILSEFRVSRHVRAYGAFLHSFCLSGRLFAPLLSLIACNCCMFVRLRCHRKLALVYFQRCFSNGPHSRPENNDPFEFALLIVRYSFVSCAGGVRGRRRRFPSVVRSTAHSQAHHASTRRRAAMIVKE